MGGYIDVARLEPGASQTIHANALAAHCHTRRDLEAATGVCVLALATELSASIVRGDEIGVEIMIQDIIARVRAYERRYNDLRKAEAKA